MTTQLEYPKDLASRYLSGQALEDLISRYRSTRWAVISASPVRWYVVNDWVAPWLATLGIIVALRRRAVEGGSYRVSVSLTRIALWIIGLGVFDREYAEQIAGRGSTHAYLDPEVFTREGPTGLYQGVTDQVRMSVTQGAHAVGQQPLGSSRPVWIPSTMHSAGV